MCSAVFSVHMAQSAPTPHYHQQDQVEAEDLFWDTEDCEKCCTADHRAHTTTIAHLVHRCCSVAPLPTLHPFFIHHEAIHSLSPFSSSTVSVPYVVDDSAPNVSHGIPSATLHLTHLSSPTSPSAFLMPLLDALVRACVGSSLCSSVLHGPSYDVTTST